MPDPRRRAGTAIAAVGAALLIASAFLPQSSPLGGDLFVEGTGWGIIAMALLALALEWRARRRSRPTLVGLWVGGLAVLNALAIAADHTYRPRGSGLGALGVGGLLLIAGALARTPPFWRGGAAAGRRLLAASRQPVPPITAADADRDPRARRIAALGALALYAGLSLVFWGLPVVSRFGHTLIAQNDIDPSQYTWFYSWWPHAVAHGLNPFLPRVIMAPDGYNLTWATAVPLPSLLSAPVNALFGPVVTYNVLALAAPPLAAWTAYLLCRRLAGHTAPALLGGFLFGFSPYMLRMLQGSPDLYYVALIPLAVLVVLRHLEGSLSDRGLWLAMAGLIALQFVTTVELVATASIFGALALLGGAILFPEHRPRLARTVLLLGLAYATAAVLVSPVLYFMLTQGHTTPYNNGPLLANDIVSWIYPDPALAIATTHQVTGTPLYVGGLAYLTAPLLAILLTWTWRHRSDRAGGLLSICFWTPLILSLGALLFFHGTLTRIGLPWALLDHFPGTKLLIPQRFTSFAFLAAGVIVALWLARSRSRRLVGAAALTAAMMVPDVGSPVFATPVHDPPFFATSAYRAYLRPADRLLTVPAIGENMRWQAEDRFAYQVAGGGLGTFPASYLRYPTFATLLSGRLSPDYAVQLRRFIADKGVTAVVVDKRADGPQWHTLFGSLGVRPVDTGGVLLYRVRRPGPPPGAG